MYQNNRQLLCTFSDVNKFESISSGIKKFYNVYNNRIFAFSNEKNPEEIYLTYNVLNMDRGSGKFSNTILIHRKKQYSVLYSINALNRLICDENGGVLDKSFVVDWKLYQNSLIITGDISVRIIPLKIFTILN